MSCSSTDKNTQLLRQQITANYQSLNAELEALDKKVTATAVGALPLTEANIFVGGTNNIAAAKPLTGDVLIDYNGVTSIAPLRIVNGDISETANIAPNKLALGLGRILIGSSGSVAVDK
jgi:hypothetical protein